MIKRFPRMLALALAFGLVSGCNLIYKQNIQQGNALDQEDLDLLRLGMSMNQVAYLLGTPAIQDPFHHDRWDYLSSFSRRGGEPTVRTVTLSFEDSVLVSITGVDEDDPEAEVTQAVEDRRADETVSDAGAQGEDATPELTPVETPAVSVTSFEDPEPAPPAGGPEAAAPTTPVSVMVVDEAVTEAEDVVDAVTEAVESAPPAPGPAPPAAGWSIQLGAFDSEENARRILDRLIGAGYSADIDAQDSRLSGTRYLIRQHDIGSREEAQDLLRSIEEELGIDGFLIPPVP